MIRILPLALALLTLNLLGPCQGPDPTVTNTDLREPSTPGQPYVVIVTVHNRSGGEGQVHVIARLRTQSDHEIVAQDDQLVDLKSHETARIAIELHPGAPGPYTPDVLVDYPP